MIELLELMKQDKLPKVALATQEQFKKRLSSS